jgi:peptidoglycan-associated lipoprotein
MNRLRAVLPIIALAVTIAVAACSKKVPQPLPPAPSSSSSSATTPPPPPPPPASPRAAAAPRAGAALTEEEIFARKSIEQVNADQPLGDVFFDLDKSEIRAEARGALQKDSDWIKRWASTRLSIEGHCDSRGSAEYNLALGSRRATAVKEYLVTLGVAADRLTIVSKGKEQPFCRDENDSCWQQNRRGHFVVTAK